MTTLPGSPRVLKGALVSLQPTVVAFQYKPSLLTRTFEVGGSAGGPEAGQVRAPPAETLQLELELDAADDLEAGGGPGAVSARIAALLGLPSEVVGRGADVLGARQTQRADGDVARGGHRVRTPSPAHLGTVLVVGHVA